MTMMENKTNVDSEMRLCPYLKKPPTDQCYCVKLDSGSVNGMLYYCGRNFHECEIYKLCSCTRDLK
jgi:hypothetical protein